MKRVAIIIVNWNGITDTQTCIASLIKLHNQGIILSIIIVDNGSTDNSVLTIKQKFPQVELIELKSNLGFSGGVNAGLKQAGTQNYDFFWLINNDTIVDPDALHALLDAFSDKTVGIAGPKIYFAPGHEYHFEKYAKDERGKVIWYAGGIIDWNNMYASHRGVDQVDHQQFENIETTDFVTGCSMIIKRSVIEKIGYFNDRYYLYLEDVDYCLRAKHAGFRLLYVPKAVIWHINAGSSAKPGNSLHEYYFTRNRIYIGNTYASWRTKFALLRESMRQLVSGSKIRRQAVWDAYTGKFGRRFQWVAQKE
jgi:GT2 family glycosyltransferase